MSMRRAASCRQPLHSSTLPREARMTSCMPYTLAPGRRVAGAGGMIGEGGKDYETLHLSHPLLSNSALLDPPQSHRAEPSNSEWSGCSTDRPTAATRHLHRCRIGRSDSCDAFGLLRLRGSVSLPG